MLLICGLIISNKCCHLDGLNNRAVEEIKKKNMLVVQWVCEAATRNNLQYHMRHIYKFRGSNSVKSAVVTLRKRETTLIVTTLKGKYLPRAGWVNAFLLF